MLVLTSLLAAAVSAATTPACPTEAGIPALLSEPAETPCDCLMGRQGRRVVACIELDKPEPRVKVLVTQPSGASARAEFPWDGPKARDIAALKVEDWVIKVGEQALGDRETIRVNDSARAGDDLFIGQEVVTFLALEGKNTRASSLASCTGAAGISCPFGARKHKSPSAVRATDQPPSWTRWWWYEHSNERLPKLVSPPCSQCWMW
jgi:hypothetical protein